MMVFSNNRQPSCFLSFFCGQHVIASSTRSYFRKRVRQRATTDTVNFTMRSQYADIVFTVIASRRIGQDNLHLFQNWTFHQTLDFDVPTSLPHAPIDYYLVKSIFFCYKLCIPTTLSISGQTYNSKPDLYNDRGGLPNLQAGPK